MSETPSSDRDKDISDNDDRPPPSSRNGVQWNFIRSGFRQRAVESNLLDVVYPKYKRKPRLFYDFVVGLGSTKV